MKPVEQMKHHPMLEQLVDVLSARTQNPDKNFFAIQACYHLTKCASMMRAKVDAQGFGNLLVNFYGINCAPSGYGKGHSSKIIEEEVTNLFKANFMDITLPSVTEKALTDLAYKRALKSGEDEQVVIEQVKSEYMKLGAFLSSFDSGTTPAVKQFRHKLLMADVGSINFEVDEIGNNLINNKDIVDVYLELYDGVVKPKLTKNTSESVRNEEIEGKTPTNMLMFGTAAMLLDGGPTEKMYFDMLLTGYARRCFFGFSSIDNKPKKLTVAERLAMLTDTSSTVVLQKIGQQLAKLADPLNHNFQVKIPDSVMKDVIEYQMYCEEYMETLKSTDEIRRAEARGRYFKALRLAGVFAFIDLQPTMTIDHWEAAVKVAEMSAECFNRMLARDPTHARLAKHLAECPDPVTYAELIEELPYFPKATMAQKDLVKNAVAWGYRNNVIIKRSFVDDIEFIHGESLQETNINELIMSHSNDMAMAYVPETKVPFDKLDVILKRPNYNWCSHRFVDGTRRVTHVIQGFNMIVLDIDGTASIEAARAVLQEYSYHIYTTKRHTETEPRFRIVIPMSHTLKLSPEEYTEFMNNVLEYLPFDTDEQTTQANRKWLTNASSETFVNDGKLFDVLPFIPKTKKNEERKKFIDSTGSMDILERFFFSKAEEGNRNNVLFKYGAALVDAGYDLDTINLKIKDFNSKLPKPIVAEELNNTVISSIIRKFSMKG